MLELLTEEPLKYNLDEIVRLGAKKMLLHALEAEGSQVIEQSKNEIGPDGKRLVTRNGVGRNRTVAQIIGARFANLGPVANGKMGFAFTHGLFWSPKLLLALALAKVMGVTGNNSNRSWKSH